MLTANPTAAIEKKASRSEWALERLENQNFMASKRQAAKSSDEVRKTEIDVPTSAGTRETQKAGAGSSSLPSVIPPDIGKDPVGFMFSRDWESPASESLDSFSAWEAASSHSSTEPSSSSSCQNQLISDFSEASGPRYRKIALNGLPKPDGKPQSKEETDEEKEETYVDALYLSLRHDTSDVYIPVVGDALSFAVKRSVVGEVFNTRPGVLPQEMPDRPFGHCWTSGLTANIKFTYQTNPPPAACPGDRQDPDFTYVTDESGTVFQFVLLWDSSNAPYFLPIPANRSEQDNFLCQLVVVNPSDKFADWNYAFTKKYGTVLVFSSSGISQTYNPDPNNSSYQMTYYYARLDAVRDQYKNTLTFTYPSGGQTLIPSAITTQDGRSILITSPDGYRITQIADPNGNLIQYKYQPASTQLGFNLTLLMSVTRAGIQTIGYTYNYVDPGSQKDNTPPNTGQQYYFQFCNIETITQVEDVETGAGNTYTFAYQIDNSHYNYRNETGYYVPGLPLIVKNVTLPPIPDTPNNAVTFTPNSAPIQLVYSSGNPTPAVQGTRQSTVVDAAGYSRTYIFESPMVIDAHEIEDFLYQAGGTQLSYFFLILWTEMQFQNPSIDGQPAVVELFTFNAQAAMALSSVVDYSQNKTSYFYGEPGGEGEIPTSEWPYPPEIVQALSNAKLLNLYYSEPISQTDALLNSRYFKYTSATGYPVSGDPAISTKIQQIMWQITDEECRVTTYGIDPTSGLRTSETISLGGMISKQTNFEYTDATWLAFMTKKTILQGATATTANPTGDLVYVYCADSYGYVKKEQTGILSNDHPYQYVHDANGNRSSITEPNGYTDPATYPPTLFEYDGLNRLSLVTNPDGSNRAIRYDFAGNKGYERDENQHVTLYAHDALNRLTASQRVMGDIPNAGIDLITSYTYNRVNSKTSVTEPMGYGTTDPVQYTTSYEYDPIQRLIYKFDPVEFGYSPWIYYYSPEPGANTGSSAFNSSGFKPTSVTDPRPGGYTKTFTYDKLYRMKSKSEVYSLSNPPPPALTSYCYDNVGNLTKLVDPVGNTTWTCYDAQNRPWHITYGDAAVATKTYYSSGLIGAESEQNSYSEPPTGTNLNVTTHFYDEQGRRVSTYQPDPVTGQFSLSTSPLTQMGYDFNGNMISLVNPLLNEWTYQFDNRNRRIVEVQPPVSDAENGNVLRSPTIRTAYDYVGNVSSMTDARGNTTSTLYDHANRPTRVTFPAVLVFGQVAPVVGSIQKAYDKNGNLAQLTDEDGNMTTNVYDHLNRLFSTNTSPVAGTPSDDILVQFAYDEVGNRTAVQDGMNMVTNFTYDGLNRLTSTIYDPGTTAQSTVAINYDGVNKISRIDQGGSNVTLYSLYDGCNRLLQVNYVGMAADDLTYTYEPLPTGKILSALHSPSDSIRDASYTYDRLHRILTETSVGVTQTYTYDAVGNRSTAEYGGTGRMLVYEYDALNRLTTITDNGT
jgi:YD repeat-containing protein